MYGLPPPSLHSYILDLSPLDLFLWGYIKNQIYGNRTKTIQELKTAIRSVIRSIPRDQVTANFEISSRDFVSFLLKRKTFIFFFNLFSCVNTETLKYKSFCVQNFVIVIFYHVKHHVQLLKCQIPKDKVRFLGKHIK